MELLGADSDSKARKAGGYLAPSGVSEREPAVDDRLYRRFVDPAPSITSEPIVYEFTKDPALLHQYYLIRLDTFRRTLGGAAFTEKPDKYDLNCHTLIVRKGRLCIGGVQLIVREPGDTWPLPSERDYFIAKDKFPEFRLDKYPCVEIFRFAMLEDYNTKEILYKTCVILNDWCKARGVKYGFYRSPLAARARLWRKVTNILGDYHCEIHANMNIPPLFEGYEGQMYLMANTATALTAADDIEKKKLKEHVPV